MLSRSAHLPARLPMRARVQLEEGENLEVGHYMERAWAAVFGVGDLNVSSASLCRKWVRDNGGFEGPLAPKPLEGEAAKRGAKRGNATRAAAGPASEPRAAPRKRTKQQQSQQQKASAKQPPRKLREQLQQQEQQRQGAGA